MGLLALARTWKVLWLPSVKLLGASPRCAHHARVLPNLHNRVLLQFLRLVSREWKGGCCYTGSWLLTEPRRHVFSHIPTPVLWYCALACKTRRDFEGYLSLPYAIIGTGADKSLNQRLHALAWSLIGAPACWCQPRGEELLCLLGTPALGG